MTASDLFFKKLANSGVDDFVKKMLGGGSPPVPPPPRALNPTPEYPPPSPPRALNPKSDQPGAGLAGYQPGYFDPNTPQPSPKGPGLDMTNPGGYPPAPPPPPRSNSATGASKMLAEYAPPTPGDLLYGPEPSLGPSRDDRYGLAQSDLAQGNLRSLPAVASEFYQRNKTPILAGGAALGAGLGAYGLYNYLSQPKKDPEEEEMKRRLKALKKHRSAIF